MTRTTRVRIRHMAYSCIRVHATLQLVQSHARKYSDMAKSRMRMREFAQIKCMRIRNIVNIRVRARASKPKPRACEFATWSTVGYAHARVSPILGARIRDMVNSHVCARVTLPLLLAKIARAKFAT